MRSSPTVLGCSLLLLLACLLLCCGRPGAAGQETDAEAECLSDCLRYGLSLFCPCPALGDPLDQAAVKRGGPFPFRYGKRQMPFRYGKRSLGKRQFRYGKRSPLAAAAAAAGHAAVEDGDTLLGYTPQRASAYIPLSSMAEEK